MQYAFDHPEEVASLTLSCPIPPYGMGGTKDISGTRHTPHIEKPEAFRRALIEFLP